MAMLRLDLPGLVLYSGAMAAGEHHGAPVTILDVWEAVGAHEGGRISDAELEELERNACPGFGACTGHFTANTMAVAVDFLGLGPIGLGSVTAMDPAKAAAGEAAGRLALDVIERGLRPTDIVTREALENAIVGVTGTGGSGGYAERVAVDAAGLIAVPEELGMDEAVALLADGRTAISLLARSNNERAKQLLKELIDK